MLCDMGMLSFAALFVPDREGDDCRDCDVVGGGGVVVVLLIVLLSSLSSRYPRGGGVDSRFSHKPWQITTLENYLRRIDVSV
mmetsp:Transcript_13908/g.33715  ORF Transcript_13908/g.33715 Transcript_13908/m.33715 type:complete len:82 (-) Transcript_13908:84-329(-)